MNESGNDSARQRVLVLAPTSKDASLTATIFGRAGFSFDCCNNMGQLITELESGAAVVLIPEESLVAEQGRRFAHWLANQPPWSDLPVLVMARMEADSRGGAHAMDLLGNVTVLERPMRIAALVSAIRSARRARQRQYQLREYLLQRERDAETLRQRIEELQTLMDTLPVGVYIALDADCRRIVGNQAGTALLRTRLGANLSKSAPPGESPTHFRVCKNQLEVPVHALPMQRAARGELVRNEQLEHVFDDGTVLHTLVSASPIYGADGGLRGSIAVVLDVTDQKKSAESLQIADRRKDEFLAVLAHELRNPLAPIRNSLHILRMSTPHDPATARVTEMMERQVNHMVRLVDDLMEVSRITRGRIELHKEPIEIAAVVRIALEASQPLIEEAGHHLAVTIPTDPLMVQADSIRLAQVLSNLLNNSAKYTERGGQIWVTVRREEGVVAISIRDTGIGIPQDMLTRVFDLFTQVDRATDRSQGGLGIGLALVKNLVEMHGGSVEVLSEGQGRGSDFIVRLPLLVAARNESRCADRPAPAGNTLSRRILVVDDNRDAANSLGLLLKLIGAEVHVAYNGADALEAFHSFKPDVVLLDIGMPGMDGYEVARRIRGESKSSQVTLIALTGWGQDEDRSRSRAAGFDFHLVKPPEVNALKTLLLSLGEK